MHSQRHGPAVGGRELASSASEEVEDQALKNTSSSESSIAWGSTRVSCPYSPLRHEATLAYSARIRSERTATRAAGRMRKVMAY